jgi:hypothetical protein
VRTERDGRRRRRMAGAGALLMTLAVTGLVTGSRAGADPASRSLVGLASASGMRATYTVPDYVVVSEFFDGGGPVAQANVDTTGKATGFGSLPYPGENAIAAPGAATLATKVPVPPYPFYAEANYPVTPSAEVKDPSGSYDLSAKADQQKAEGLAAMNFFGADKPVSRIVSQASGSIDAAGAKVTATAVNQGLSFGDGALRIASATSRSVTTYAAGAAKPETKSELLIEGATVGGQSVTIGPDGVHPFGQSFAFPGGADQLNQALRQAGITVRTLSLQNGPGGATSDAMQVTVKHPIPGSKVMGTFVYEIGGSTSSIDFGAAGPGLPTVPGGEETTPAVPPAPAPAPAGSSPAPSPSASSATSAPAASADLGPATSLAAPSTGGYSSVGASGASLPAAGEPGAPAGLAAPAAPAVPVAVDSEPVALARPDLKKPGRVLMAVLAAAGAILLAASTLWRKAL